GGGKSFTTSKNGPLIPGITPVQTSARPSGVCPLAAPAAHIPRNTATTTFHPPMAFILPPHHSDQVRIHLHRVRRTITPIRLFGSQTTDAQSTGLSQNPDANL